MLILRGNVRQADGACRSGDIDFACDKERFMP